jgi:pilus assembly protein CpaB
LAIVVAGGGTYFLYKRLILSRSHPQTFKIVAAAKDLPAGIAVTADELVTIDWPNTVPLAGSYNQIDKVTGHPLIYPLEAKEPVLNFDLADPNSGLGLSVKIPQGMRATSVKSNAVVGVASFLYPGSHVDVLGTYNVPGGKNGPVTQTVLENVQVLTAGEKIEPDPSGKPQTVDVVTLLLSPEHSQKLLLASSQSVIQFVLRNGADPGKPTLAPTQLYELVAGIKKPAAPAVRRRVVKKPVKTPAPPVYVLEIIQGDKRTIQKF